MPLNYLRNVGINTSSTSYTFYNDVDLVPSPNMNLMAVQQLKQLEEYTVIQQPHVGILDKHAVID